MNALIALIVIAAIVVLVVVAIVVYAAVQNKANDTKELIADRNLLRKQLTEAKAGLRTIARGEGDDATYASLTLDSITLLEEQHDNKQEELTR